MSSNQLWQVVDSESAISRDDKKVLFENASLEICRKWRKDNADNDNIRIRTKPQATIKKEEEYEIATT